jgi:hypothetical protein
VDGQQNATGSAEYRAVPLTTFSNIERLQPLDQDA